ncbi:hypothetical protein L1987_56455 [Smallanthus sonchifolius]|uniref:Uncharacterized protein n=1 Tax=Smallanthus sonchifolius TaxID=185202 RepID=A0ACB9EDH1_9ASTR|nr:hypothetical protein L1987_56455 [Smallanthus sonchifolius]
MGCQGAMDIDLPTEVGPTEETVDALMEYLVGPLLPLKHTCIAKETQAESKQKSVAKQVHAVVVLYNYYHLNQHRGSQFLKFDQFCELAIMLKPSILHHMKYMCQSDHTIINDPENQLSLTEKAIMDACTISETLLNASANISNVISEWKITKVAVLLIDSKKENCFLQFNDGVWLVIEKELYSESKKRKKIMIEYDEEGEVGFLKFAFSAVKEVAGIVSGKLKVLESHVVYSLSQAKTATRFYIVQSTQAISEEKLVPIQDVISSLQGPVVKECLGSWAITPVVEYYYLLPYAEIISKLFSRESNGLLHQVKEESADVNIIQTSRKSCEKESGESKKVSDNLQKKSKLDTYKSYHSSEKERGESKKVSVNLQKKSKLDSEFVHISNSSKEPHESEVSKSTYKSDQCSEKESGESKKVSDTLQKKSNLDSKVVHISNLSKEVPHVSKVGENMYKSNQCSEKESGESKKVIDNLQKKSKLDTYKSNQCNEKESGESKEVSYNLQKKSKLDSEVVHISNSSKEEPHESKLGENTYKSIQCSEKESGESKEVSENLQKRSKLDSEIVHISSLSKEVPHVSKVGENMYKSNQCSEKESGESKKVIDNLQKKSKLNFEIVCISNSCKEESHDSKVGETIYKSNQCSEKESGESKKVSDNLQKRSKLDSEIVHMSNSSKEEPHDSKVGENMYKSNQCSEKENGESKKVSVYLQKSKLDSEIVHISNSSKEEPHDNKVSKNTHKSNQCSSALEPVSKVADGVITSQLIGRQVDQTVKETENSVGNSITVSNSDSTKLEDMNGYSKDELKNSSSGANNNLGIDELLIPFQKENKNTTSQSPLKVYRYERRNSKANRKDLKKMSSVSQSKDERVDGEKSSCKIPPNEDRSPAVNSILGDVNSTVDAKRSELSDAAVRALLYKRQKLYDQQRVIDGELALCDKKIQAIMHGGNGDCLGLELEAVIECCNEFCKQVGMQTQQLTNLHASRSLPILSGKSLSEAQLTLRKACQELDDICLSNNWMLPTYRTSRSDGGFAANVTVKGTNFECSGVSGDKPSIHEARNSAATNLITRLQQMANGTGTLV